MLKVVIEEERCKGCALCTIACSRQLLSISTALNAQGIFPAYIGTDAQDRCTSCALCARMCPDVAISVYRDSDFTDRRGS